MNKLLLANNASGISLIVIVRTLGKAFPKKVIFAPASFANETKPFPHYALIYIRFDWWLVSALSRKFEVLILQIYLEAATDEKVRSGVSKRIQCLWDVIGMYIWVDARLKSASRGNESDAN